ncbi:MAG: DUF6503 family protein [Gilvibacter sp.]
MKQIVVTCFVVLFAFGCKQNTDSATQNNDAKALLQKALQVHGEQLYNAATVTFTINNYDFVLHREGYNYRYEMSRQTDTAKHTAVTFNGGFEYLVDGQLSTQGPRMDNIVKNRLNGVASDFYLPFELTGNDAIHSYEGQEVVRGKQYHKVKVAFKQIDPEVPDNRIFMLWIESKTFEIDFIGKQDGDRTSRKQFAAAANKRRQSGMLITDFENYQTRDKNKDVAIDSLGIYYNGGMMLVGRKTTYQNSDVKLNN